MNEIVRVNDERLDELEAAMFETGDLIECPLFHTFTEGLYSRKIFMPKGSLITSKIHKTQHQYVVLSGELLVSIDGQEWQHIKAPYMGITKAGTRRILHILEDTEWVTFHSVDIKPETNSDEDLEKAVKLIEDKIIEKHDNKLLNEIKDKLCLSQQ